MMRSALICAAAMLLVHAATPAFAGQETHVIGVGDFILDGGASYISGTLRTGDPGQITDASSLLVLAPGATITEVSTSFRYITGYEKIPSGLGVNVSLQISDQTDANVGTVLAQSPHLNKYPYSKSSPNYSEPVPMNWKGSFAVPQPKADTAGSRLQFGFQNNDRNLQLHLPITVNITCTGVSGACFVPAPAPKPVPPPAPLPPAPPPPHKTGTSWENIGPKNIGDDIYGRGEAGTIDAAVSVIGNPNLMYMGGTNNAASPGVLKSTDYGMHWTKMANGLTSTSIFSLYIVDDVGDHLFVGTSGGLFETMDGAETWVPVTATNEWGGVGSFRNGTINGVSYLFLGFSGGLGTVPINKNGSMLNSTWNLIRSPSGSAAWRTNQVSLADFDGQGKPLHNSKLVGCLWIGGSGKLHLLTMINETAAEWDVRPNEPCQSVAIDPNNADRIMVNNESNGAHVYETLDGGKTFHGCGDRRGAVMVTMDRRGNTYTGSEAGAFVNRNGCVDAKWDLYFVRRTARRTGEVRDRSAHDYQRVNIDFAGGVAFGSDQGMFIQNWTEAVPGTFNTQLYSANGDLNNNVIMHPAIAMGDNLTEGKTCVVTALWDWSPVASWDGGDHWPSWQTPDDGSAMNYFGEGGGCYGLGESKNVICGHHHDLAYSSRCGKNMGRLIVPNGGAVTPPTFERAEGSRSKPSGIIYMPTYMGRPPYTAMPDKALTCEGQESRGNLGVHNESHSCMSQLMFGSVYNWYSGANVAVWRGDTDKICYLCKLDLTNKSGWGVIDAKGAVIYPQDAQSTIKSAEEYEAATANKAKYDDDGEYAKGPEAAERRSKHKFEKHVEKMRKLEYNEDAMEGHSPAATIYAADGPSPLWLFVSPNFGLNWTFVELPENLQNNLNIVNDPTSASTLYGLAGGCIFRSFNKGVTWDPCWKPNGLVGNVHNLVIRDSLLMIALRSNNVPLRTKDGGKTWSPMYSLVALANYNFGMEYSWSGKTLALSTIVGRSLIWVSTDDGDTWVDESGDYTALSGGIAQWYDNKLFLSSMGQGIVAKVFIETKTV